MATYTQVGSIQDISNIVENITPYDTPFTQAIGKVSVSNTLFSWLEEELADVKVNAMAEGADAPKEDNAFVAQRQNYTQIFARTAKLSGSEQVQKQAGNIQTMAHAVSQRAKELKRDVEFAYVGSAQTASAGTAAAPTRKTAGYQAQVDAGNVIDAAGAAVTEDQLNEMLVRLYEEGAMPDMVMAHPRIRMKLTDALEEGRVRELNDTKRVVRAVNIYVSDTGDVEIHSNRECRYDATTKQGDILVFDSSMWDEAVLRDYRTIDLAKTGDADSKEVLTERGLINRSFKSAGLITNASAA